MTNRLMKMTPAPLALAIALALASSPLSAQTREAPQQIRIAAQPLAEALNDWARQTRIQLVVQQSLVAGKTAPAISGSLTPRQALDRLLAGSGLAATMEGNAAVINTAPAPDSSTLPAVTVVASGEENATSRVQGYVARRSATGTKTDTPIIETPQSISVVTADRIEAIGATNLKDALGYTPGVSITTYGADSRYDWISLRGFDAYSPGFYLDGLPLRNNSTWGVWRTENYGAERIELLRGPSSVLYGMSGPGGVVNVVSKRPTAEPVRELQVQIGDHARRQVAGDFSGALDADGKVLYRITGLLRDAQLPAAKEADDRTFIAPSLTWKPSGDTTFTLLSQFSRTRSGVYTRARPQAGSLDPTAIGTYIPSKLFSGEPGFDHFNQDQEMLGYQFEHRINDTWTVRQNARYAHQKLDYQGTQLGGGFATLNPDVATDPANFLLMSRKVFGSREKIGALALDNQAQADFRVGETQHKLLIGLDYQRTRIDQVTFSGGSASPLNIYAPVYGGPIELPDPYFNGITRLTQTGFYLQDQIKWGERWTLMLGGRYDNAESTVDSRIDGTRQRMRDHKFTSRAGLVYLHPSGWAPYLSYSESFAPTATIDPVSGNPFKPESGKQVEAGVRYQPVDSKALYSAAVFDLRRKNYISYNPDSQPKQTGEISVRGLELEATAEIASRMNLTASYSYTPRAIVTASSNPSEIGKQATAVPRHRLSVWADYRFANGVKVGLGARYTGSNYGDGEAAWPSKVPASTVFDAMVGYDIDRWSLALNLRNLTNKTYIANCGYGNCYYGYPRTAVATATYRW